MHLCVDVTQPCSNFAAPVPPICSCSLPCHITIELLIIKWADSSERNVTSLRRVYLLTQASGWVHPRRWKIENLGWNLWAKHTFCTLSSPPVREPWTFTLRQTQLIGAKCSALGAPMTPGSFNLSSICNPLKHSFRQWLAWGSSSGNVFSLRSSKFWRHKMLIYFSLLWSWLRKHNPFGRKWEGGKASCKTKRG